LQAASATPQLLYPREGAVVASAGIEFRWKSVPGAFSYDIRVVTEDGDLIWEGQSAKPRAVLPSNIRLASAQSFYVRVRAHLPEGKTITSKLVGFKVKNAG
jgi:hypothetical protein